MGGQHSLPVGQAGRLAPGRHPQRHGRLLAGADQGRRRVAFPVHPLHRHRADDPRSGRDPRAQGGRRDSAEADGGDELPVQLRRSERGRAAHRAVLRDLRQPGDLQGRLVGRVQARPHPLGRIAERRSRDSPPAPTTRTRTPGSCTTCPTTSPRPRTWPPSTRRNSQSSRSSSGRRPKRTTSCR